MKSFPWRTSRAVLPASLLATLLTVGISPTARASLSVINGTFDTATVDTDVDDWFDVDTVGGATEWWVTTSDVQGPNPFPDNSVMLGELFGSTENRGGRWLYQEIGAYDGSTPYYVSLDYGQPTDGSANRSVGVEIAFYQGTFSGADDVDIATGGLTVIDSFTTPFTSGVGFGVYESFSSTIDLSTANSTDPIWIRIANLPGTGTDLGSWVCIDNVAVREVETIKFVSVTPEDGATGVPGNPTVEAVIADGTSQADTNTLVLTFDGVDVTASANIVVASGTTTVSYATGSLDGGTVHTAKVVVAGMNPTTDPITNQWSFTVMQPITIASVTPEDGATGVPGNPTLEAVFLDGTAQVDPGSIRLVFDGIDVTAGASIMSGSGTTRVSYATGLLAGDSVHTAKVVVAGMNPTTDPITNQWTFSVGPYNGGLAVRNGDFEDAFSANRSASGTYGNEGSGGVTETIPGWYSTMDLEPDDNLDPWWGSASYFEGVNPFDPSQAIILGDLYSTGNGVGERYVYQPIGTWDGSNTAYLLSVDMGQPTDGSDNRLVGLQIDFYQGAFPGAADNVDITNVASSLTLVDSLTTPRITLTDGVVNFRDVIDLSAANTTDPLWLRISDPPGAGTDVGSWVGVDNVEFDILYLTILSVSPADGSVVADRQPTLEATILEGSSTVDPSSLVVTIDGVDVTESVSVSSPATGTVTLSYSIPTPLASDSVHTARVVVAGMNPATEPITNEWTFTEFRYTTAPVDWAFDLSLINEGERGFWYRDVSSDDPSVANEPGLANTEARAVAQLAGRLIDPATTMPYIDYTADDPEPTDVPWSDYNYFRLPEDDFYSYAEAKSVINMNVLSGSSTSGSFYEGAPGAYDDPEGEFLGMFNWVITDNLSDETIAYLELAPGFYTFGVNSDDGFVCYMGPEPRDMLAADIGRFDGSRAAADTLFGVTIEQAGLYPIRLLHYQGTGTGGLELFTVQPDGTKVLVNDDANGGVRAWRVDPSAQPPYISYIDPLPGTTVSTSSLPVSIELIDGDSAVDSGTISLAVNGAPVAVTPTKVGNVTTVIYDGGLPLPRNTFTLIYSDGSVSWTNEFEIVNENAQVVEGPMIMSIGITPDGASAELMWTSETGSTYSISRSMDLPAGGPGWSVVQSNITGSAGSTTHTVTTDGGDVEIYRVEDE